MQSSTPTPRSFTLKEHRFDVCVIGGGMSGIAAAVTAAREGSRVALVHDRPVLGGNGSKEIRVWLHGADGGKNNAYFRETGLMEELRLRNLYENPDGNIEIWNLCLLNLVLEEPNLTLFLNTHVSRVDLDAPKRLGSVWGVTGGSERLQKIIASQFVDATGDGTVAFLAGAEFASGREARSTYGESLAPEIADPYTLSGTILFQVKDTGRPTPFIKPPWAHTLTEDDLKLRKHPIRPQGVHYWWIEYGGIKETVDENEAIRDELLRIVYGIWDHLKNHPNHREENKNLQLEWVGALPGKRESRRFLGDVVLTERDILEQTDFPDAVAYGGWDIDRHPPRGFWAKDEYPSDRFQIPGLYNIPLRALYAKGFENLFLAGRDASFSHVALCSTRVMVTCAQMGEAVGIAAAHCLREGITPRQAAESPHIEHIQRRLLLRDHYWWKAVHQDPADLALQAKVTASSTASLSLPPPWLAQDPQPLRKQRESHKLQQSEQQLLTQSSQQQDDPHPTAAQSQRAGRVSSLQGRIGASETMEGGGSGKPSEEGQDGSTSVPGNEGILLAQSEAQAGLADRAELPLDQDVALMFPYDPKEPPTQLDLYADVDEPSQLVLAWYEQDEKGNYLLGRHLGTWQIDVPAGQRIPIEVPLSTQSQPSAACFTFLTIEKNPGVRLYTTPHSRVGVRTYRESPKVIANGRNDYSRFSKIDENLCFQIKPEPKIYAATNVIDGHSRPFRGPRLWSSAATDFSQPEWIRLEWDEPVELSEIHLKFNTDLDLDLRNLFVPSDERAIPACVKSYSLLALPESFPKEKTGKGCAKNPSTGFDKCSNQTNGWEVITRVTDNYQRFRVHTFPPRRVRAIELCIESTNGLHRAEVYEIRAYPRPTGVPRREASECGSTAPRP